MMANYLLDIVILLTAAVITVPLCRAAGFGAVPGFLVAGFGRVGRRIGQILEMAGKPYVAIDFNSSLVLRERAAGHRIFYGDVRRPEVLRAAGIGDAKLVIVRGHNAEQCRTLQKLGASLVVSENLEASLELAREALLRDHSDADEAESLILRFRDEPYSSTCCATCVAPPSRQFMAAIWPWRA
jgi:voltage-gated potassium channel Kch